MREIPLHYTNKFALVSDEDYERCARIYWYLKIHRKQKREYVMMSGSLGKRGMRLHTFIIGKPPDGLVIDHINGNGLDNRRENLRFVTPKENARNRHR